MKKIGDVTHYYTNLEVGIIKLEGNLKVGDNIKVQGTTTDFEQKVPQIEIDHKKVDEASAGDEIGIKVDEKVRNGDEVFLVA